MALGIYMAASHYHGQMPTHAHIMVAGWLMSSVFAFLYHLFPETGARTLATVHFRIQGVSGVVLVGSLFALLRGAPADGGLRSASAPKR